MSNDRHVIKVLIIPLRSGGFRARARQGALTAATVGVCKTPAEASRRVIELITSL